MRLVVLALCLVACSPAPPAGETPQPSPIEAPEPVDMRGEWRLTAMNGRPAPPPDGAALHPITLTVGDFTLRAQSQCVAFWRRYEWEDGRLVVTNANPGAMCARGLSDWETEFSRTLSAVAGAERRGDGLHLTGSEASLIFEPAPPLPKVDITGRWRLRFFHGAAPAAGEAPVEITIGDGVIEANACVFAGWRYRQDGPLLEVTPSTGPVCERTTSPLEDRFGDFMDGVTRATILPDGALILDSAAAQVEFRKVE
jgi:hypothetical protein